MNEFRWALDEALGFLSERPTDTFEAAPVPEQTVDTVLLRNLDAIPIALFGSPGRFVFHSAVYWGEFDVCCMLADRRLVAFENKGRPLTKRDFTKFCRDVRRIQAGGFDHVHMRFQHVTNQFSAYLTCAERMFAATFLGVRCDTQKDARSLSDEACAKLHISRADFLSRFRSRNGWLEKVQSQVDFRAYLSEFAGAPDWREFIPILLVPAADVEKVHRWRQELDCGSSIVAHLATYQFGLDPQGIVNQFALRRIGQFTV